MFRAIGRFIKFIKFCLLILIIVAAVMLFNNRFPLKYYGMIKEYSEKYGLNTTFVCAVIHAESRFNPSAVSSKGARGLMQLTQSTADWAAEEIGLDGYDFSDAFDPRTNIELGCWYLAKLKKQFGDDMTLILAAYNAGSGNVSKWLQNDELSLDKKTLEAIPFPETEKYVDKISRNIKIYDIVLWINNLFSGGSNEK